MAEPCGDGVIGAAIAHQRQRTDPPRALVAGVVVFQAFADRLVVATQSGNDPGAATDNHRVDIATDPDFLMAVGDGHGIVISSG